MQAAKASRKQSSLSGKDQEVAQVRVVLVSGQLVQVEQALVDALL